MPKESTPTQQFIEIEDKIIGPFTIKQFIYIAVGAALCFVLFFALKFWVWILIATPIMGLAIALAFVKINGRPLAVLFISGFKHFWQPRLYIWKKTKVSMIKKEKPVIKQAQVLEKEKKELTSSRLKELAWKLDIKQKE